MQAKTLFYLLLLAMFLIGGVDGLLAARHDPARAAWLLPALFAFSFLNYCWYYYDAQERGYQRSKWLNIGVLFMAPIGYPYYVLRRSLPGTRIRATLRMLGLAMIFMFLYLAGIMVGMIFG